MDLELLAPLTFARVELVLRPTAPLRLRGYPGAALRGMFKSALAASAGGAERGLALARAMGVDEGEHTGDPSRGRVPWSLRPLVSPGPRGPADLGVALAPGEALRCAWTVFGDGAAQLPAALFALHRWGLRHGLGAGALEAEGWAPSPVELTLAQAHTPEGPLPLWDVSEGPTSPTWDPRWSWSASHWLRHHLASYPEIGGEATAHLLSPLDLREDGEPIPFPTLSHLLRSLGRGLHLRWPSAPFPPALDEALRALLPLADTVAATTHTSQMAFLPYRSNRQGRAIPLSARVGALHFQGDLAPLRPWLLLSELLHLGKGQSMGLGAVRWEPHEPVQP